MKTKKNKSKNQEKKRSLFFYTGLMITGALVLVAFEWTSFETKDLVALDHKEYKEIEEEIYVLKPVPPKPQPQPKQVQSKPTDNMKVVDKVIEKTDDTVDKLDNVDLPDDVDDDLFKVNLDPVIDNKIHEYYTEAPQFPGGDKELYDFLSNHIKYPKEDLELGIQGTVWVSFVVSKSGEISEVEVLRTPSELMKKEALKAFDRMPVWTPGKVNDKVVNIRYKIPIKFIPR